MQTDRIMFLIIGVVVVAVVGRLARRGGGRYLTPTDPDGRRGARASATLVSVMFHLVTLGLVALLAVPRLADDRVNSFLIRLGVLLIVLAVAHGLTLGMLRRRRQEEVVVDLDQRMRGAGAHSPTPPDQPAYEITNDPPPAAERPLRREPLS